MNCQITEAAEARLWPALLALKRILSRSEPTATQAFLVSDGDTWHACESMPGGSGAPSDSETKTVLRIPLTPAPPPFQCVNGAVPPEERAFLRLYVPIIVGGFRARVGRGMFVTGHLAQTLDGRIACTTGHSQWIGNQANLRHAHRLRALHDGILVGGRTVETDDPRLTVRHVEGPDPRRYVLSGRGRASRSRPDAGVFRDAGCVLLCAASARLDLPPVPDPVTVVELPSSEGRINPQDVLAAVAATGSGSLFVEGGGVTLSSFLGAGLLDVLHVHIAPRILGSGVSGFRLPEVDTIGQGSQVHMTHYELDGELLFECRCPSGAPIPPAVDSARP